MFRRMGSYTNNWQITYTWISHGYIMIYPSSWPLGKFWFSWHPRMVTCLNANLDGHEIRGRLLDGSWVPQPQQNPSLQPRWTAGTCLLGMRTKKLSAVQWESILLFPVHDDTTVLLSNFKATSDWWSSMILQFQGQNVGPVLSGGAVLELEKPNRHPRENYHGNGKSPFLVGDTSSNGWFSIVMLLVGG